jgi:hypothetical protein
MQITDRNGKMVEVDDCDWFSESNIPSDVVVEKCKKCPIMFECWTIYSRRLGKP